MDVVLKLLAVAGLGAVELWAAVPAGLAFHLHPAVVGGLAALGAVSAALLVALLGERVRARLLRRHVAEGGATPRGLVGRIWRRFGVIGLGLAAPLLLGTSLGTALGIALGVPPRRLVLWIGLGAVACSAALTLAATLGLAGIGALRHR